MLCAHRRLLGVLLTVVSAGCGGDDFSGVMASDSVQREAERWSPNERPSLFAKDFEYRLHRLPTEGKVRQMPWPGSHWPLSDDGVNVRWDGPESLSAIEKYGQATGVPHLEDKVSRHYGLDAHAKTCSEDSQCPRHKPKCGIRRGARKGACVGVWWGVCHGWSPAAIGEAEPQHPVVYNGVEFKVNDIKALLTLAYVSAPCTRLAQRSEMWRFKTDRSGRAEDEVIRQINPGALHVALANVVGLQEASLILDHDISYRVFNHPVASYRVAGLQQVDASTANRILGVQGWWYRYASRVASWHHVRLEVTLVMDTQAHEDGPLVPVIDRYLRTWSYSYILEVDAAGMITGGEWVGKSKLDHPDFVWRAGALQAGHRAGGAMNVSTIRKIADLSRR